MANATRDSVLALLGQTKDPVPFESAGVKVWIHPMSQRQFAAYQACANNKAENADQQAQIIVNCVRDADGGKIFTQADVDQILNSKQTEFLTELLNAIAELTYKPKAALGND